LINYSKNLTYVQNDFESGAFNIHFHEEYAIALICDGNHSFSTKERKYTIPKDVIRIINPYELHATHQSSWSYINFMPTINLLNTIASDMSDDRVKIDYMRFKSVIDDPMAIVYFRSLFTAFEEHSDPFSTESSLIEFFSYLIKRHSIESLEVTERNKMTPNLKRAVEYINDSFCDSDISLAGVSQISELSKFHLIRQFKKNFGVTPAYYLKIKRINQAKKLLLQNTPLSQIAYECGFYDQSHFTKTFRQFFGYTPKKLQKNNILV
jgi:AraC-like DNA-binding protein